MIRWLILLVLVIAAIPYVFLAGYGFYHGLDIVNGLKTFSLGLVKQDLVYSENKRVAASELGVADAPITWRGKLENERLGEASGLAFGNRSDVLFAINDSGNPPELFATGTDGSDLGVWPIDYPERHDFEDLASFEWDGTSFLLVADTGDNFNWRPYLTLLVIAEPLLETLGQPLVPVWSIRFRFPDGYRDIEGVAVDEQEEQIYLVSKRRIPAEVFRLPLTSSDDTEIVTAKRVARLRGVPAPTARDLREDPQYGESVSSPTAFDLKGRSAMVVTYKEAYLFRRSFRSTWDETFSELPVRVRLPEIHGLESGAFVASTDRFFVTGEREDGIGPMDVFEVRLP
ncbi:MAG: hypothetical protein ISP91_09830 [Pseudomonadales bacterium]|nr:hypothetical protein [Pseudomonadales bacterium]